MANAKMMRPDENDLVAFENQKTTAEIMEDIKERGVEAVLVNNSETRLNMTYSETIDGRRFTLGYPGHVRKMQILKSCTDKNGQLDYVKLSDALCRYVIMTPRWTPNDFDMLTPDGADRLQEISGMMLNGRMPEEPLA